MTKINLVNIEDISSGGFVTLKRLTLQNIDEHGYVSEKYTCDVASHRGIDAVAICLWRGNEIVTRTQLRPIICLREKTDEHLVSIPAGICEEGLSIEELAVKEIEEEVGISVDKCRVQKLGAPLYSSVGWVNEKIHFVHVQLTEEELYYLKAAQEYEVKFSGEIMEQGARIKIMHLSEAKKHGKCMMYEVAIKRMEDYANNMR